MEYVLVVFVFNCYFVWLLKMPLHVSSGEKKIAQRYEDVIKLHIDNEKC